MSSYTINKGQFTQFKTIKKCLSNLDNQLKNVLRI